MFGTSGIRGPVGEEVDAELAVAVGRALGMDAESVVVGRDPRESGRYLTDALAAGLLESGTDVIDLGMAATPTVARAVGWETADAGVSVTASHNPPEDNGLKLWQPSGQAFDAQLRDRITTRVEQEASEPADWDATGARVHADATERHVQALVDAVDFDCSLRVAVDVGNGAGGVTADALDALGCHVVTLNAQPDGSFPGRPSEPTAANCESLTRLVETTDADLGLAHDGDADRLRAVTGDGVFLSGDVLLALFAREAADAGERVAVPVDTSRAVEDYLADAGIETTRTRVGDVYVAEAASQDGVAFGGEPSGAWIWPEETLCPDGPLAACRLAELAATHSLSDRVREVPTYPIRRSNVRVDRKAAVMDRVRDRVQSEFERVSTLDGVRVDTADGWFLIRASGTQPLLRITAEATGADRAETLHQRARELLGDARDSSV